MRKLLGFLALGLFLWTTGASAAPKFYRIIQGARPTDPEQIEADRFRYGCDVLYTEDAPNGPVLVDGIVWQASPREARYFIGTRNPVIDGYSELARRIENNKWEEAKVMQKAIPTAFPKTENMAEVLAELKIPATDLDRLARRLKKRYPQGFFLKAVEGFNSAGTFPSEKTAFSEIFSRFSKNLKPKIEQLLREDWKPEEVHLELKDSNDYEGRIIEEVITHPERVIIQAKIKPARGYQGAIEEYRVHIIEGEVLAGATQHRWGDPRAFNPKNARKAEIFSRRAIRAFPAELRNRSFGFDVMIAEDGSVWLIEVNEGGESGYLYPETDLWVPQLLVQHYTGELTPIQKEVQRIKQVPEATLRKLLVEEFLNRKPLQELAKTPETVSEIFAQAGVLAVRSCRQTLEGHQ